MKHESIKYFYDILNSISLIEHHIKDISSLTLFIDNLTVIDAVERRLSIIGEALYQVRKEDNNLVENISDYKKIIGLRHILVHDYDLIDHATIWIILTKKLPILKEETASILNNEKK